MRKVWGLAGVTLALVAAALYLAGRETPPIRIGILHSTSGTMALSELPLIDAAQLAVAEINREGGVLGRRLEAIVADGQSDPAAFAAAAERLIAEDGVSALFGTWTSASRKAVKPVVEREDHLLFYPLQYEGLEQSPNIIYLGAVPNQQILPAVRWALFNLGPRFYLVGSDYVFPRAAHEIIRTQLSRWPAGVVGETFVPLGSPDVGEAIRGIIATKPDVILSTLNGDSNVAFFEALGAAGLSAETAPVVSFSVAEEELQYLPAAAMQGHYAAWSYFQSTVSGANERFLARFRDRYGAARVTSDPIETAYVAVRLYAEAVAAAGSDDPARVREALADRSFSGPGGLIHVDGRTRHTWKTMRIGRIRDDGQFDIVWTSGLPVAPLPFPALRPEQEWTAFLDRLQAGWGGNWAPPQAQ
ncbi:MAG: urea ABC transporter substrate-binding protein [Vicinamibacterales bacterium]